MNQNVSLATKENYKNIGNPISSINQGVFNVPPFPFTQFENRTCISFLFV